jgi:hypothetical protein
MVPLVRPLVPRPDAPRRQQSLPAGTTCRAVRRVRRMATYLIREDASGPAVGATPCHAVTRGSGERLTGGRGAPGAALLGGAAAEGAGDAGPLGAVARHQAPQRRVLPRAPGGAAARRAPRVAVGSCASWQLLGVAESVVTSAVATAGAASRTSCGPVPTNASCVRMWAIFRVGVRNKIVVSHLMAGSRCRLQRPMHCWSVRPCHRSNMHAMTNLSCKTLESANSDGNQLSAVVSEQL